MVIGFIFIILFLLLASAGMPIMLALIFCSFGGMIYLVGIQQTLAASAPLLLDYIAKYEFSVIPMFIFMGSIGFFSGIVDEVFAVARKWIGRLPGGLAVSVVVAQVIFGAFSGSSIAACVVIGKSAFPAMKNAGYNDRYSTGVIAGSGGLSMLIPPSIIICIYGLLVDESIGLLLIGGILPGLLIAAIYAFIIMIWWKVPRDSARYSFREKVAAIRYLWVIAVLIFAIIGGIYGGIVSPTEAGAFGAFVMFMLTLVTRRLNWDMIWKSVRYTVSTSGMVLILIVSAVLFTRFLTLSGFSHGISEWVGKLAVPDLVIFVVMVAIYLFLGCFIGATGMMVMTLPTFFPVAISLGWDPIWFGIIVVLLCEIAVETPPVGVNLYAVKSIAPDVSITTVIRGVVPFVLRDIGVVWILYFIPEIVTLLPNQMLK